MLDDRYYDLEVLFFDALRESSDLPLPGNYMLSDVVKLVDWQGIVHKVFKEIYGGRTVHEYIEEHDAWTSLNFPEDIQISLSREDPGIRFGEDSDMYIEVELDYQDSIYTMIIPVTHGNNSLFLMGVAWLDGPERLLHTSEYAVTVERKGFKTKKKYHFSTAKRRDAHDLDEVTFHAITRLEDMAIYALMELNRERLIKAVGQDELFDHYIFLNWTISYLDAWKYKRYVDPGYTIPETFRDLFLYSEWALDNGYMREAKLEPEDIRLPASPDNFRWVTRKKTFPVVPLEDSVSQFRPTRYYPDLQYVRYLPYFSLSDLYVTSNGKRQTLLDWARETGLPVSLLYMRHLRGEDDRLTEPREKKVIYAAGNRITHEGETKTVEEWSNELGLPIATILSRIRYGWPEEDLLLPAGEKRRKKQ